MLGNLTSRRKGLAVIATICLLGAGLVAVDARDPVHGRATNAPRATAPSPASPRVDGALLARLEDYTRSIGAERVAPQAAAPPLPDVNTMIDRLAARLEHTPADVKGWQMLGWSYFHTGRFAEAAAAYAKAVELEPGSEQLQRSYEEAKSQAATPAPPPQAAQ